MTHAELVDRAAKWLRNFFHCRVVLSELKTITDSCETPDAIGWVHNKAILIECKASRNDFYNDRKKKARHKLFSALGVWRFYLTPPNLLRTEEIIAGWGIYEVRGRRIIHTGGVEYCNAGKPPFESCRDSEVAMLVSALSRIRIKNTHV